MNKMAAIMSVFGGIALLHLAVGSFTHAWLIVEFHLLVPEPLPDAHAYASYGLFYSDMCMTLGNSPECKEWNETYTGGKFHTKFESLELGPGLVARVMMSLSWSCCLASISLTVFSAIRNNFPKTLLLLTGICWFVTAVFLFVAIGLEAAEMPKFRDMLKDALNDISGNGRLLSWKFIIKIPWSIVIVGIGATYALVNSVLSAIFYRRYTPEPVVRQWYPLQNGTSVQTNNSQNVANSGAVFEQENQQRNMAQQLFPVLGQGNQNQNSASPGPMSTQGNHIKIMAGLQLSDNDNQTRKLAYPPPDTVEGNQQQTMAETEFLVWGHGDQPKEFAYPAPVMDEL